MNIIVKTMMLALKELIQLCDLKLWNLNLKLKIITKNNKFFLIICYFINFLKNIIINQFINNFITN